MANSSILLTTTMTTSTSITVQKDTMNLGTQVLMVVYIGAAVILSVVPFGIYFYITCKKLGVGRFCKRVWNRCRKKPQTGDTSRAAVSWPYRSRPRDEETGAIYMIDLPSYDEVMRNADNFKITSDIKVFYSVYNRQSSQETQTTSQTSQTNVQTDSVSSGVDNARPRDVYVQETSDITLSRDFDGQLEEASSVAVIRDIDGHPVEAASDENVRWDADGKSVEVNDINVRTDADGNSLEANAGNVRTDADRNSVVANDVNVRTDVDGNSVEAADVDGNSVEANDVNMRTDVDGNSVEAADVHGNSVEANVNMSGHRRNTSDVTMDLNGQQDKQ